MGRNGGKEGRGECWFYRGMARYPEGEMTMDVYYMDWRGVLLEGTGRWGFTPPA